MTSPLDPRSWVQGLLGSGSEQRSWLDSWVDLTTWWIEPSLAAAQTLANQPIELLTQMIDGMAARYAGQQVELSIRGQRVSGWLDALRLLRRGDRHELRVDTHDIDIEGLPFRLAEFDIVVRSLSLVAGLTPTLVATDIEMRGRAGLEPVIAWAAQRVEGWQLGVQGERVTVTPVQMRSASFAVEPVVRDNTVTLEFRGVRWGPIHFGLPRWLRFERSVPIELAPGLTVVDAVREGDQVRFQLHLGKIEQRFEPKAIRDAIMHGSRLNV
jgi:hypothetical protein